MDNLILIAGTDTRQTIEDFVCDVVAGLKGAYDRGVILQVPEEITINGTYVAELAAQTETTTNTTPEVTKVSTSVKGAATNETVQQKGSQTNTSRPPGQRTEVRTGGADSSEQTYEYEG